LRGGKSTKKPWKKNIGQEYCLPNTAEPHPHFFKIDTFVAWLREKALLASQI
jgi:hypothetical protein